MKVKKAFAQNQTASPEQKYELSVSIGFSGCCLQIQFLLGICLRP